MHICCPISADGRGEISGLMSHRRCVPLHDPQVSEEVSSWSVLDATDVSDCNYGSQVYDPFNIQVCCIIRAWH